MKGKLMIKKVDQESNVVSNPKGLLPEEVIHGTLRGSAIDAALALRSKLKANGICLREKLNKHQRYLGYGLVGRSDALYVYVTKAGLCLDIKIPAARAGELRGMGFQVRPRNNYQHKAGWLTGLIVPKDTDKLHKVAAIALEALS